MASDNVRKKPSLAFNPSRYICHRIHRPLEITGSLEGKVWDHVAWTDDFVDISGDPSRKPRLKTRAKMVWDDQFLYVAAEMEEPHLWASLTEPDSRLYTENDFELFIDPDGDTHNYYEIEINPLNTIWDLMLTKPYRDGGLAISSWNLRDLHTAVWLDGALNNSTATSRRWSCELAVPFAALDECRPGIAPPKAGDQWRMNLMRVQWNLEPCGTLFQKQVDDKTGKPLPPDYWVWSSQGIVNMHYPEMWGFVQFSNRAPGESEDAWCPQPDESIKWGLRSIYYAEHEHHAASGTFVTALHLLESTPVRLEGYEWKPEIEATSTLFEVRARAFSGNGWWHIREDGRIWLCD